MQQLDLFRDSPAPGGFTRSDEVTSPVIVPDAIEDEELLAALPDAGIADSIALANEAGRRRISAAIPALEALCRRLAGFGADRIVPEQAAAIDALAQIAGAEAAQALARLIVKRTFQGPCLHRALGAAARLGAELPATTTLELLRHDNPAIRAEACRFVQPLPETVALLRDLLADLQRPVRIAAACALGLMGCNDVRSLLIRYLREESSAELIEAVARIADEECVILLGRIARTMPHLTTAALEALDAIEQPQVTRITDEIRVSTIRGSP